MSMPTDSQYFHGRLVSHACASPCGKLRLPTDRWTSAHERSVEQQTKLQRNNRRRRVRFGAHLTQRFTSARGIAHASAGSRSRMREGARREAAVFGVTVHEALRKSRTSELEHHLRSR